MQVLAGRSEVVVVLATLLATAVLVVLLPQRVEGARAGAAAPAALAASVTIRFAPEVPAAQRRAAVRAAGGTITAADGRRLQAQVPAAAVDGLRTAMGVLSVARAGR